MNSLVARGMGIVALACVVAACDSETTPAADSVAAATPQAEVPPPSWTGTWPSELGEMLVVPSDTDNTAIMVYPDAPGAAFLDAARLYLLTSAGEAALTDVRIRGTDSLECGNAPVVGLSGGAFGTWTIGVTNNSAVLRTDSVETMAAADSAKLVASLARLASAVTGNDETRFTGLPFTVLSARRFTVTDRRIVASHLVRRVPQEASPLEEHMLLVAERPLTGDSLRLAFSRRSEGAEETAEHFEILTAISAGSATLLLVARDNVAGTHYELLERAPSGAWRVRWSRPLSC